MIWAVKLFGRNIMGDAGFKSFILISDFLFMVKSENRRGKIWTIMFTHKYENIWIRSCHFELTLLFKEWRALV